MNDWMLLTSLRRQRDALTERIRVLELRLTCPYHVFVAPNPPAGLFLEDLLCQRCGARYGDVVPLVLDGTEPP